jgi:hypothetical protein
MVHLRATGQIHILVVVFDGKQVPKQADVCVGCNIYCLYFKPDEVVQHVAPDPDEYDL